MKKIYTLAFLFLLSFQVKAQFCTWCLDGFRVYNNTSITTKVGAKTITPINVGGNIDSLARYVKELASVTSGAQDLQGVLNTGNIACASAGNAIFGLWNDCTTPTKTNSMSYEGFTITESGVSILGANNTAGSPELYVGPGNTNTKVYITGSNPTIDLTKGGNTSIRLSGNNTGLIQLRDATSGNTVSFLGAPLSGGLSASRVLYPPNQTGTILVEASVNRSSSVTNSTFGNKIENGGYYTSGVYTSGPHLGHTFFSLWEVGTGGRLDLYDAASNFAVFIKAPTTLTATRTFDFPDHDGTLTTNNGGNITSGNATTGDIVVTHSLGFTPTRVFYQARNQAASVAHWVSAITSTTFTITYSGSVPTPVDFDWQAF
jgi:hypothetical protein